MGNQKFRQSEWYRRIPPRLEGDHFKGGLTRDGEKYDPFGETNLPNAFSKVRDEKSAKRFIERYGLLGYSNLKFGWSSSDTLWHEEEQDEPLSWILGQAATVRFALDIIGLLGHGRSGRYEGLRDALKAQQVRLMENEVVETQRKTTLVKPVAVMGHRYNCAVGLETLDVTYLLAEGFGGLGTGTLLTKENPLSIENEPDVMYLSLDDSAEYPERYYSSHARDVIARLVSGNTTHVRQGLHHLLLRRGDSKLAIGHMFYALIEVIWHHVGNMAVLADEGRGNRIGICEECGTSFVASRKPREGHPEFCPPEMDQGRGSRCGLRYRTRERRKREREVGR